MLSMRISDVIAQIIEHELVQKERVKDEAVYLNFDLRMYAHVKNNPYSSSCGFHLLYHSLSNYVSVFSGITSSPFGKLEEVKEWRHEVSHDFEWRRPPIFSEVYFELAANVNDKLAESGLETIAPASMQEVNSFRIGQNNLFKRIKVAVFLDKDDPYKKHIELR